MSKFDIRFSFVISVLCVCICSYAFAAPSVKRLGGANTYKGTVSAASAKSGMVARTAGRSASARTLSQKKAATVKSVSTGGASNAARLSVGKYLHNAGVNAGLINKTTTIAPSTASVNELILRMDGLESQINDKADTSVLNNYYNKIEIDEKLDNISINNISLPDEQFAVYEDWNAPVQSGNNVPNPDDGE